MLDRKVLTILGLFQSMGWCVKLLFEIWIYRCSDCVNPWSKDIESVLELVRNITCLWFTLVFDEAGSVNVLYS